MSETEVTAVSALRMINRELKKQKRPALVMDELQMHRAFQSLQQYMAATGRPVQVAVADIVRFQMQSETIHRRN
jgi:predicted Co/Zn/Cd cation transporter (cation efflux family)